MCYDWDITLFGNLSGEVCLQRYENWPLNLRELGSETGAEGEATETTFTQTIGEKLYCLVAWVQMLTTTR